MRTPHILSRQLWPSSFSLRLVTTGGTAGISTAMKPNYYTKHKQRCATTSYVCSRADRSADRSADPSAPVVAFCFAVVTMNFGAILGVSWLEMKMVNNLSSYSYCRRWADQGAPLEGFTLSKALEMQSVYLLASNPRVFLGYIAQRNDCGGT